MGKDLKGKELGVGISQSPIDIRGTDPINILNSGELKKEKLKEIKIK